ncbi:MAG: hypothetical protein ACAH80_08630 [Alphaproteobacteria bacterium]
MSDQNQCETGPSQAAYVPSPILQYFKFDHLPEKLQPISRTFHATASWVDQNLPNGAEKTVALRKLLEGKDAAVRAALPSAPVAVTSEQKAA